MQKDCAVLKPVHDHTYMYVAGEWQALMSVVLTSLQTLVSACGQQFCRWLFISSPLFHRLLSQIHTLCLCATETLSQD